MWRFERTLAFRHLRSGGWQTLMTMSAVAAGVVVVVFVSSMVFGLQANWVEHITDMLPSVTVSPLDQEPQPLAHGLASGKMSASRIERGAQQVRRIEDWLGLAEGIRRVPGVAAVAPAVTGQGFATRGGRQIGVLIYGAQPEELDRVMNVSKYLGGGRYLGIRGGEVVLNFKLADELGLRLGDRVRLMSSEGRVESFLIQGFYDPGDEQLHTAFITLRAAQSLFATGTAAGAILVRCNELFDANAVAARIRTLFPYKAESWAELYPSSATMVASIGATGLLISGFSLFAASFAIAAVLIVSVLQKGKQIGILKSIGAKNRQILAVFMLEGLGIAVIGSSLGALLGSGVGLFVRSFKSAPHRPGARTQPIYPCEITWELLAAAMGAAILATLIASILPARRAARMDPVDVMRLI
jgi:lipoprotein-releasing system permease protein